MPTIVCPINSAIIIIFPNKFNLYKIRRDIHVKLTAAHIAQSEFLYFLGIISLITKKNTKSAAIDIKVIKMSFILLSE